MKYATSFQIALSCIGFSIIPAFAGDIWNSLPESFRWTVYASQVILLASGVLFGKILQRS